MTSPPSKPGFWGALAERNYRLYMTGASVSLFGLWIQRIAAGWLTWQLTESGTWLGIIAFADLFPAFVLTPIAGVYADRIDRLRMIVVSQSLQMVQAIVLAVLTAIGWIDIWSLFGLTLFLGCATSINTAARLAVVPSMVSRANLSSAIAIDSTVYNLARIVGPAVGGAIILVTGIATAFAVNAASFVLFIYLLTRIRIEGNAPAGRRSGSAGVLFQALDGLRYAWTHNGIYMAVVLLAAVAIGVRPMQELLPGFADQVFGRGAEGLSILTTATGIGATAAALWLAQRRVIHGLTTIQHGALIVGAGSVIGFAMQEAFWLAVPFAVLAGFCTSIVGIATQTLMQTAVDESVRGRVMSLYGMFFRGMPAIGALFVGGLSAWIGLGGALTCGGILTVAIGVYAFTRIARTRKALEPAPGRAFSKEDAL